MHGCPDTREFSRTLRQVPENIVKSCVNVGLYDCRIIKFNHNELGQADVPAAILFLLRGDKLRPQVFFIIYMP